MPRALEHAADQRLDVDLQVEDQVRRDGEAVQAAQPLAIDAAHAGARQRREDVAVRQHDEAGLQRRDDFLLEPIGEVGGVEQHERQLVQRVARLGQLDGRLHQRRSRPAGFDDAVAFHLEPFAQQLDLRAAADAVGAFDRDQLAGIAVDRQIGDAAAVVAARLNPAVRAVEPSCDQTGCSSSHLHVLVATSTARPACAPAAAGR